MKKILTFLLYTAWLCVTSEGFAQISGKVFRDYNGNGLVESTSTYKEAGIQNVVVKAYNAAGSFVDSVVTTSLGTYSFTGLSFPVRIEFTGLLNEDYSGPAGTSNATSVQFYTSSNSNANFGVNYPQHFNTSTNPFYFTSQFEANRPPSSEPLATAMLKTQYNSRGKTYSSNTSSIAKTSDIGGTWGIAYDRKTNLLYASAFVKRHASMKDNDNDGKEDIGAIYSMTQTGSPVLWKDLSTLGIDFGLSLMPTIASRALPTTLTGPSHDADVFSLVGKIGIGGITLSDDFSKLYVMNLYDKKIYIINTADQTLLGSSPVVPNSCAGGNSRPFGLKFHRGKIYVGTVCDAATSQSTGDLNATVYSFDGTSFTSVLNFPLNYVKGYTFKDIDDNNFNSIQEEWGKQWNPWSDALPSSLFTTAYTSPHSLVIMNPQPMLVSLEFDVDESLILVFNDRFGHQTGQVNYGINTANTTNFYTGLAAGDMLRASLSAGGYVLENAGVVGGLTGSTNNNNGPGGGEFYRGDHDISNYHAENIIGGSMFFPGKSEVAALVTDPIDYFTGGAYFFDNVNGDVVNGSDAYQFYATTLDNTKFGKVNGLGDMELISDAAPLEIGNRVWADTDNDGIQDAGELGISGVTVELYLGSTLVGTTTTNGNGNYYFNNSNVNQNGATKLEANTAYEIRINTAQGSLSATPILSAANTDGSSNGDERDSDGMGTVSAVIALTTGGYGANNHSYDFGFGTAPPCSLSLSNTTTLCSSTNSNVYTLSGEITFSGAPSTGTLTLSVEGGYSQVYTAPFSSPLSYNISNLYADGVSHNVSATFSATPSCTVTNVYTAPSAIGSSLVTFPMSTTTLVSYNGSPYKFTAADNMHYPLYSSTGQSKELYAFDLDFSIQGVSNYAGFCVEKSQSLNSGTNFTVIPLEKLSRVDASNASTHSINIPVGGIGKVRAGMLRYLFDNYYVNSLLTNSSWDNTNVAAFAAAVAEITHESYSSNTSFSLKTTSTNGYYYVPISNNVNDNAAINLAETYLQSINTLNWSNEQWMEYESVNYNVIGFENSTNQDVVIGVPIVCASVCVKPNAGVDQTANSSTTITLTGTAPTTGTWSAMLSNPLGATLSTTTGGIATASFSAAASGTYSFIYNIGTSCEDTMDIIVTPACILSTVPDLTLAGISFGPGVAPLAEDFTLNGGANLLNENNIAGFNFSSSSEGSFYTLCTEITQPVLPLQNPYLHVFNGSTDGFTATQALHIAQVFQAAGFTMTNGFGAGNNTVLNFVALQAAIWNATYDTDYSVTAGSFQLLTDNNGARALANSWLSAAQNIATPSVVVHRLHHASGQDLVMIGDVPPITVNPTAPTCADNDGGLTISGFIAGQRYQYSSGSSFNSGSAMPASITAIPVGGVIVSNLTNTSQTYTVRVYDATDDNCFTDRTVSISPIICPACLGNYVWNDINKDGIQNNGEVGVAGISVTLLDISQAPIGSTITDAYGYYQFCSLVPGTYSVSFTLPSNYTFTSQNTSTDEVDSDVDPITGITTSYVLASGDSNMTADAGIYFEQPITASVGNYVWLDVNQNGIQDNNEQGISGVTVTLYNAAGDAVATMPTNANGFYLFTNVTPGNYTVGFTAPVGLSFTVQNGATNNASNSDADPSTGVTAPFTVNAGDEITYVDAGLFSLPQNVGSLGNRVWYDVDQDGVQDATETGVNNVTVTLYQQDGTTILNETVTDAYGNYIFNNLAQGSYVVGFSNLPINYVFTTTSGTDSATNSDANIANGKTPVIFIAQGQHNMTYDAGIYTTQSANTNSIGNYVWDDLNKDGIQTNNEPGVAGVTVTLYDNTNAAIATTSTDANGLYLFPNLPNGTYYVGFSNLPLNYVFSPTGQGTTATDNDADPSTGKTATTTLTGNTHDMSLDAGINYGSTRLGLGTLGDLVWYDMNNNGLQDNDELGVQGVTVTLYESNGTTVISTTTTNALGNYIFTGLEAGAYIVGFDNLPSGFTLSPKNADNQGVNGEANSDVNSGTNKTDLINLGEGEDKMSVDMGIAPPAGTAGLGNYVWMDLNNDGLQTSGEPGVQGIGVTLYDNTNTAIATTTTDANGEYYFVGLTPGTYHVGFSNLPSGFGFTAENSDAQGINGTSNSDANASTGMTATVTLASGDNNPNLDAGIVSTTVASVGDYVWYDINQDGLQEANEPGIGGVLVTLYNSTNTAVASTITRPDGSYIFTNVTPGDYTMGFSTIPSGMEFTQQVGTATDNNNSNVNPNTGLTATFTVTAGTHNPTIDAGLTTPINAGLGNYVWYDVDKDGVQDSNEPGIAGAIVTLYAQDGTTVLGTAITDGNGAYTFTNLPAGQYSICVGNVPYIFHSTGNRMVAVPTTQNAGAGTDETDSDINPAGGCTINYTLAAGEYNPTLDAGFVYQFAVPVVMKDFTVLNDQCTVFVNWTTSSEKNTSHYNVMRTSINTNITTPIAQISAKGNTQDKTSYSYTDREVTTGSYTYHLEIVDIDGHQSESDKKSVQVNCQTNTDKVSVYPNPTTGQLNIRINSEQNDIFVINVRDAVGRLVMQTTVEVHNVTKNTLLNLSELSSGTYSVEVKGSYDSQTFKIALSK